MLKLKLQYFGHPMWRIDSLEKTLMLGKIEGRGEVGDRGWDGWMAYQLNGHDFEQTPGDSKGQGSLVCCSPWGHKELDTTEWLNKNDMEWWKDSSSMKHFPFVLKNFCLWPISTLCFYPSLSPNLSKYCGRVWGLDDSLQKTRSSLREAQLWFLSHR